MSEIFAPGSISGPPAVFMGPYATGTSYSIGAAVSIGGSSYISLLSANLGHTPTTSPGQWALLAAAGAMGTNGAPGANGVNGAPGTPGTNGQVTNAALVAAVGLMSRVADGAVNQLNPANGFGGLLNGDGSLTSMGGFVTTGFTKATGSLMLTNFNMVGNDRPVMCYDLAQTFIGHATLVGGGSLPDPTTAGTVIQLLPGTAYVKGTSFTSLAAPCMIVFGDTLNAPVMPSSYQSFTYYPSNVVDSNIASAVAGVAIAAGPQITATLPSGRNLYDTSLRSDGFLLEAGGVVRNVNNPGGISVTGFMLVSGLGAIYCNAVVANLNGNGSVAFYDASKGFLSFAVGEVPHPNDAPGFMPNTPITVPANAVYARLSTIFAVAAAT